MNDKNEEFRTGVFAIVGEPNAGKSTLLNRIIGQKIVITSPKPQTTRDKIAGILSDDTCQMVFVDTPGFVRPQDLLHEALMLRVQESLEGVDAVIHLRDATHRKEAASDEMAELLRRSGATVVEVWNKIDLLNPAQLNELSAFKVSALTGEGIDTLLDALRELAPEGPPLYSPDDISDRDLRFLVAEIVREKIFEAMRQEIPYSVATQTEEYIERDDGKDYILVHIYVEQESQKGMVIGKGGQTLKTVGELARPDIEELTDHPVFLELRVKVRKNWTKHPEDLKHFGYTIPRRKNQRG